MITGISIDLGKKATGIIEWERDFPALGWHYTFNFETVPEVLGDWSAKLSALIMRSPDWIAVERARPRNLHHQEIHWGMMGLVSLRCFIHRIPLEQIVYSAAKKALTGSGRAGKEDMLKAAQKKFPHLGIVKPDVADALGVGLAFLDKAELGEGE